MEDELDMDMPQFVVVAENSDGFFRICRSWGRKGVLDTKQDAVEALAGERAKGTVGVKLARLVVEDVEADD